MLSRTGHHKGSFTGLLFFSVISFYAPVLFAYGNTAILSWAPPVTDMNGAPLTDIGGFIIYYGSSSRNYTHVINVGRDTSYEVSNLTEGLTYYFAVTAYDTAGNESKYSQEVSKLIISSVKPAVDNPGGTYSGPSVSFTGHPTGGTAPLTVKLSNATREYDRSYIYSWDFDNNGVIDSTFREPSVLYQAPGVYSIKLTATDLFSNKNALTRTNYITVCYSLVNIAGNSELYSSLQTAYGVTRNMDTIQVRNEAVSGGLNIDRNITVSIEGGHNCLHSEQTGQTTIMGNIRVSSGKFIIQSGKIVLQ
ncbi:MAG: PKD domain-containing protein [Nitrospiraceae bacterium]|nr:MAG: PKD domain-containing protein [Nitrospiraceae bacterium]